MELKEYIASSSIGFSFGILTTFLAEWLNSRRDSIKRKQAYLDSLALAQHEIIFYTEKFNELSETLGKLLPLMEKIADTRLCPPASYISPESLEKIKRDLGTVSNNPDLMLCLSRCHADICSIGWKIKIIEKENDRYSVLINLKSLEKQAADAVKQFKLLDTLLEQELSDPKMRGKF